MSPLVIATYILVLAAALGYIGFFVIITIGGFFDLIYLFKSIKEENVDAEDDGRVVHKTPKERTS